MVISLSNCLEIIILPLKSLSICPLACSMPFSALLAVQKVWGGVVTELPQTFCLSILVRPGGHIGCALVVISGAPQFLCIQRVAACRYHARPASYISWWASGEVLLLQGGGHILSIGGVS